MNIKLFSYLPMMILKSWQFEQLTQPNRCFQGVLICKPIGQSLSPRGLTIYIVITLVSCSFPDLSRLKPSMVRLSNTHWFYPESIFRYLSFLDFDILPHILCHLCILFYFIIIFFYRLEINFLQQQKLICSFRRVSWR